jgi:8-oxo-dGTP pyrophosphatase MutT (NUDIX family)
MTEHDPWTVLTEKRPYENPWITIHHREVLTPSGAPGIYGIVRFKRLAVGVLPIDDAGRVHLVGQWRPPLGEYSWEMPEGGADPGETAETTARRELKEETGLTCDRLIPILKMALSNSVTDERAVLFLGLGLNPGLAAPEDTEALAHKVLPFRAVLDLVLTGAITDAMTVAAVLRAHHMAVTGEIPPALAALMLNSPTNGAE